MCDFLLKMAKPKQKKVKEAKEALALAQSHLADKQTSLAKVGTHVISLHFGTSHVDLCMSPNI